MCSPSLSLLFSRFLFSYYNNKGAITSKIKYAIKHKTSPARLAQLLQPSLVFCFRLQPNANDGTPSSPAVVQVLQDLFYVLF